MTLSFLRRSIQVIGIVGLAAVAASAQSIPLTSTSVDPRWAPWLGCWQIIDETEKEAETLDDVLLALSRARASAGARVCVTPAAGGVTMTTLVDDQPVLAETVIADGTQRPIDESGCKGWQRSSWSTRGARLFADAELDCPSQSPRKASAFSLMLSGPLWLDVQMIEAEGRKNLRVRRYHRSANQKQAAVLVDPPKSPVALSSRLSIEDVKEAVTKVAPETVQAAIYELKKGFDLTGDQLIQLDRAGVPDQIIDLMVAQSFPKQFTVERNTSSGGGWGPSGFDDMWPYYGDPFFYTSYYAPFGYRYWGHYDPYYFSGPGFVVINPPSQPQPSGNGRVVDGRGYTRVRMNEPTPGVNGGWNGGSSANGGSSGSGSSSGGAVSGSGYSSGGGSDGGGTRTAVQRPPGQ
jgi:hypothetical protein